MDLEIYKKVVTQREGEDVYLVIFVTSPKEPRRELDGLLQDMEVAWSRWLSRSQYSPGEYLAPDVFVHEGRALSLYPNNESYEIDLDLEEVYRMVRQAVLDGEWWMSLRTGECSVTVEEFVGGLAEG